MGVKGWEVVPETKSYSISFPFFLVGKMTIAIVKQSSEQVELLINEDVAWHSHAFLCLVSFLLVPLTLGSGDLGNYRCHFILLFLISLKFLFQFFAGLAQVIWAIIAAILSFLYVSCSPLISFSISTFLLLRFVG